MASTSKQPDFGILLLLACQEFVRELRESLAAQGFDTQGSSDGYVFRALNERPMTVSALANRLQITKQGAGQIVDDMESRGYIERHPDPRDGRARLLHLTPRAKEALATARRFHHAYERRLARTLDQDTVATARKLLTTMAGQDQTTDPHFRALFL